jgi:exodeoxyribonuclease V alpha subunit
LRRGIYGADHLNRLLYQEHQKRGAKRIPIMITVNDPQLGLYNGDTGFLELDENKAVFNGRTYPEYLLPDYEYAYVLSVHKSQGSEYERVMVILPDGSEVFGKEMLYTAVTRAKREISLLAHSGVIEKLVKTPSTRFSGLRMIIGLSDK